MNKRFDNAVEAARSSLGEAAQEELAELDRRLAADAPPADIESVREIFGRHGLDPRFRSRGRTDLRNVRTWLTERSPGGARNVLPDIMRTVGLLPGQPGIGRQRHVVLYRIERERPVVRAGCRPRRNRPFRAPRHGRAAPVRGAG